MELQHANSLRILKGRGWTLDEEYADESISAFRKNVKRPRYEQMVSDYKADTLGAIV